MSSGSLLTPQAYEFFTTAAREAGATRREKIRSTVTPAQLVEAPAAGAPPGQPAARSLAPWLLLGVLAAGLFLLWRRG